MAAILARKSVNAILRSRHLGVTGQAVRSPNAYGMGNGVRTFATKHSFSTDKDDEEREKLAREILKDWNSGRGLPSFTLHTVSVWLSNFPFELIFGLLIVASVFQFLNGALTHYFLLKWFGV